MPPNSEEPNYQTDEELPKKWYHTTTGRILLVLIVPMLIFGLYLISTGIILRRPATEPVIPDPVSPQ